ncbi:MAG: DUF2924 domain-containing protein [Paracoccaceae bacterium]
MMVAVDQDSRTKIVEILAHSENEAANSQPSSRTDKLEEQLARLDHQDAHTLQDSWRRAFGRRPPGKLKAEFLRRALAHEIQEQHSGGLNRQALIRLKAWSKGARGDAEFLANPSVSPLTKPGTRFVREWQSEMHEVQAIKDGSFVYRAKAYRSLTEIAKAITGTHQSGPRFFGLRKSEKQHG